MSFAKGIDNGTLMLVSVLEKCYIISVDQKVQFAILKLVPPSSSFLVNFWVAIVQGIRDGDGESPVMMLISLDVSYSFTSCRFRVIFQVLIIPVITLGCWEALFYQRLRYDVKYSRFIMLTFDFLFDFLYLLFLFFFKLLMWKKL